MDKYTLQEEAYKRGFEAGSKEKFLFHTVKAIPFNPEINKSYLVFSKLNGYAVYHREEKEETEYLELLRRITDYWTELPEFN